MAFGGRGSLVKLATIVVSDAASPPAASLESRTGGSIVAGESALGIGPIPTLLCEP